MLKLSTDDRHFFAAMKIDTSDCVFDDPELATREEVERIREQAGYQRLADACFAPPCQSCADLADALEKSDQLVGVLRGEATDYRDQRDLLVARLDLKGWLLSVAIVVIGVLATVLVGRG